MKNPFDQSPCGPDVAPSPGLPFFSTLLELPYDVTIFGTGLILLSPGIAGLALWIAPKSDEQTTAIAGLEFNYDTGYLTTHPKDSVLAFVVSHHSVALIRRA